MQQLASFEPENEAYFDEEVEDFRWDIIETTPKLFSYQFPIRFFADTNWSKRIVSVQDASVI